MDDGEIRQAMTALETYNQQLESLGRQVQILRASMDDAVRARETLKALKDAEAGDDVLLPIGASSFVNVKISDDTRVIAYLVESTCVSNPSSSTTAKVLLQHSYTR